MLYCYRMIYYYFQNSEERDSTLSALIYVCSFCDSIGRSGELYWNVLLYIFLLSAMKSILHPRPHSPFPLLRVKRWLNGCYISLCLKSYSYIFICAWTQNGWTSLGGGVPWDQIIHGEIRVYVWKSFKTHFLGKLSFEQNLKCFTTCESLSTNPWSQNLPFKSKYRGIS